MYLPERSTGERQPGGRTDISHLVQFALFGKSVIWNGRVVAKQEVINQFRDLHHIFRLPNMNRDAENAASRQRFFFGRPAERDFWLLEAALIAKPELARLACLAPISVPLEELGADTTSIEHALTNAGYIARPRGMDVTRPGDFAWEGPMEEILKIFLRPASYPCSIVGIGRHAVEDGSSPAADCDALYLLRGATTSAGGVSPLRGLL